MKLVLATHNSHKRDELQLILGDELEGIELLGYDGPAPVEDGDSCQENALIKARAASQHTGLPAIADDSGIFVDALGGAPGVRSARFSVSGTDADNLALLLSRLGDSADRAAHFSCAAALVVPPQGSSEPGGPQPGEWVELGIWRGDILHTARGSHGFGYDPIFRPTGMQRSAAELQPFEKNAISHRARAFRAVMPLVREQLMSR
ncbi:MAG: non-canonical purine NTP pyrophosphatase [Rhodoglobus sp.]